MDNHSFTANYLQTETGLIWETVQTFDISGLEKISAGFWARQAFYEIERRDLRVARICTSHKKWFKDLSNSALDFDDLYDQAFQPGTIGTLYGARIYLDETIPKQLAIVCSDDDYQKAIVLINNNWLEKEEEKIIMPKISKFQWMQKRIEREEYA